MIQHQIFSNGGFVLHKVQPHTINSGHCSAWYDAQGKLLDAEHFDRLRRARPVRVGGPTWQALQGYGRIYRKEENANA